MKTYIIHSLLILFSIPLFAQEEPEKEAFKPHEIAVAIGLTHVPVAFKDEEVDKEVYVPTICLDYFYHLKEKWKFGAVIDFELGDYLIDFNRADLSRENAIITAALAGYEVLPRWCILVGPGFEHEKNKDLFVFRLSSEYEFELGNHWALFPSFNYDFKEEFSTWALNVGVSKRL